MGEELRQTPASCPRGSRVGPPQPQELCKDGGAHKGTGDPRPQPSTSSCHSSDAQARQHHEPPRQGPPIHPSPAHLNILVFCSQTQSSPAAPALWCRSPGKSSHSLGREVLLLLPCTTRSATACSPQVKPNLQLCKVPGAASAILAKGRKTEAFNHKTVATFPVV